MDFGGIHFMKIYVNAAAPKQGNGRKETPFKL